MPNMTQQIGSGIASMPEPMGFELPGASFTGALWICAAGAVING